MEVVAYGPGLGFVRKGSAAEVEIQGLEANHVRFVVCENSMRMQHISDGAPHICLVVCTIS